MIFVLNNIGVLIPFDKISIDFVLDVVFINR